MSNAAEVLNDPIEFMSLFLWIKTKTGEVVRLVPNRAQRHFYQHMSGRDLILKARQLGFSTFIQGLYYFYITTNFGRSAVTISHDRLSTSLLRSKFQMFYDRCPPEARPVKGKDDKILTVFPDLDDSTSYIGTAGNKSFGRGDTCHHGHLSEFSFWRDPEILLTGFLEAVPDQHIMPESTIIVECTPNGASGKFFDMCEDAKEGKGEWKLHFYAWWWDKNYQLPLTEDEERKFSPSKQEKLLMDNHHLSREQIKWRRKKIDRQGVKFKQEYPEDPDECFLHSGEGRFDRERLSERIQMQCVDPIEERLWQEPRSEKDKGYFGWRIYKQPDPAKRYIVGADPSGGKGLDSATAIVREYETNEHVATLEGWFEPIDFARHLRALAVYYNYAFVGIERNNHGHTVLGYLLNGTHDLTPYGNLYFDERGEPGWHTNHVTRPVMIDDLADEYRILEHYITRDERVIRQAMRFVLTDKRSGLSGEQRAEGEKHDDMVMADAIVGQMRRKLPSGSSIAYLSLSRERQGDSDDGWQEHATATLR